MKVSFCGIDDNVSKNENYNKPQCFTKNNYS